MGCSPPSSSSTNVAALCSQVLFDITFILELLKVFDNKKSNVFLAIPL